MKRLSWLMCILAIGSSVSAATPDVSAMLSNVAKITENALVMVECKYEDVGVSKELLGMGVCYDAEAGEFMTLIFEPNVKAEGIKELKIILPGADQDTIEAEFLGYLRDVRIGFIRAKKKRNWQAVRFAAQSDVQVGKPIVSAGLLPGDRAGTKYFGSGFIAGTLRVPQKLHYVTGGRLTCMGSPVFNSDGIAIGLVTQSIFMDYQMIANRGSTSVMMHGRQETAFFKPVEGFVDALSRIPSGGAVPRLPWLGILRFSGVGTEEAQLLGMDRPAVRVDKVIPNTPAAEAGVKTRDVIVAVNGQGLEKLPSSALTAQNLFGKLQRIRIGEEVTLTLRRGGQDVDVKMKTVEAPLTMEEAKRYVNNELGLMVRERVPIDEHVSQPPISTDTGLPVLAVGKNSSAQSGGIRQGDLIVAVNGQPVNSVETIEKIISDSIANEPGKNIVFLVRRGDQSPMAISVMPPKK